MDKNYIYILTNKHHTVLYVGVTTNIVTRIYKHKKKLHPGFTNRYNVDKLVYYEWHETITVAIKREKQLKKWKRCWKIKLIESINPEWNDLSERFCFDDY